MRQKRIKCVYDRLYVHARDRRRTFRHQHIHDRSAHNDDRKEEDQTEQSAASYLAVQHHRDQQCEHDDDRNLHDGLPYVCDKLLRELRILHPDLRKVLRRHIVKHRSKRGNADVEPHIVEGLSERYQQKEQHADDPRCDEQIPHPRLSFFKLSQLDLGFFLLFLFTHLLTHLIRHCLDCGSVNCLRGPAVIDINRNSVIVSDFRDAVTRDLMSDDMCARHLCVQCL